MGELCDVFTGGEAPADCIKGSLPEGNNIYPIWANGTEVYGYTSSYKIDKDSACISSIGANTGAIFFHKAFFTPIIRLKVVVPVTDELLPRFLYYALTMAKFGRKNGSVPNINSSDVKAIQIPVPPISEQQRIIETLDKFDSLVNDISSGLPAEIETRRKQYEHYRDKLLSFKELVA